MNERLINILLVEDDEVDVMNIQRAFHKNKISNPLHLAGNGLEALQILRGENGREKVMPQVILLDINMPKMGGLEFLENLRADEALKHISVFVMTTSAEESDKVAAYDLNVAGYVLKPLSFESFVTAIATMNNYWKLCEQI